MKTLIKLYLTFFKIGAFTFGGGYAMLPLLQKELVDKRSWISEEEMLDYYAIGQSTPGIIAVNTSTFCGVKRKGVLGGIFASLGFITPSIIIICLIANFLKAFAHFPLIQHAFAGIRIAVSALVLNTVINMLKKTADTKIKLLIFFLSFLLIGIFSLSPIIIVISCGVFGILFGERYA